MGALDHPELDTWLARALFERGALSEAVLRRELEAARAGRAGGRTLAQGLVAAGLVDEREVAAILAPALAVHTAARPRPRSWGPGGHVDDYALIRKLGAGGMGEVWEAVHRETGARRALKALPLCADHEAVLRFRREGEGWARVDAHPNVVRIHAAGVCEGRAYLVLDLLPDGDLGQRLAAGPLAPEEARRVVRELARGLEHVHAQGVLHRDLKPANVLFAGETPQLTDFGLARLLGEQTLTQTGAVLGTPSHMAPEQIDPSRGELGPATDVYGLGAILYHCLTGRPPFGGASAMEALLAVIEAAPQPPCAARPEVPRALEAVCLRALAKRPEDRYPSAAALGAALEALDERRGGGRRAWMLALAGVVLAALAAGGVAATLPAAGSPAPVPSSPSRPTPRAVGSAAPSSPPPSPVGPSSTATSALDPLIALDLARFEALTKATRKSPPGDPRRAEMRDLLNWLAGRGDPYAMATAGFLFATCNDAAYQGEVYDPLYGQHLLLSAARQGEPRALGGLVLLHLGPGRPGLERDEELAAACAGLIPPETPDEDKKLRYARLAARDHRLVPVAPELARALVERRALAARARLRAACQAALETVRSGAPAVEALAELERRCDPEGLRLVANACARAESGLRTDRARCLVALHRAALLGDLEAAATLAALYMPQEEATTDEVVAAARSREHWRLALPPSLEATAVFARLARESPRYRQLLPPPQRWVERGAPAFEDLAKARRAAWEIARRLGY
ncbi:MAG: serine/threonine-protein kinase [Planctomycetota bacterium]